MYQSPLTTDDKDGFVSENLPRNKESDFPQSVSIENGKKKFATNENVKNFMESLAQTLSQIKEMEQTRPVNIDRVAPEMEIGESLQFEIRVLTNYDAPDDTDNRLVDISGNKYRPAREPRKYRVDSNQAEDEANWVEIEEIEKDFENVDEINDKPSRFGNEQNFPRVTRHKRAAQNQNSSDEDRGNSTQTINPNDCYHISGVELANMIGLAYDKGVATGTSSTTSTELPQNVFAVEDWMSKIEMVCIVYFTIEFLLRLTFCPSKLRFMLNFFTFVDILSLVSMYAVLVLHHVNSKTKYTATYVDVINCFQVVRVFRFFRLVKDVTGFRVLIFSVRTSWRELLLLLLYIVMLVSIFASLAYYCERTNMGSILRAAWWAVVTMTTVGYGDIAPNTALGRLVGAACALSGVLLIAVTVPVFVNNFLLFYEHSKIIDQQVNARKSGNAPNEDEEEGRAGGGRGWKRTNSASTTSTSTTFSRQESTLSSAPTPVETGDKVGSAFHYADNSDTHGHDRQRRTRVSSGKASQVSLTRVQPAF